MSVHAGGQGEIIEEAHVAMASWVSYQLIFADGHDASFEVGNLTRGVRQFQWSVNAICRFTALL